MLDAYVRKSARLPTEASDGRRVIEDVITSTLFSPLKFMAPEQAGIILSWISGPQHKSVDVESIQFWRRFRVDERSANEHTIEPDLVIDGRISDALFRWIIEVKWDAVLLLQQVEDQVRFCARDNATNLHISLIKSAEFAVFESSKTTVIQWNELLRCLGEVLHSKEARGASLLWCRDAIAFLEKLGVGIFAGFEHLALSAVTIETLDLSPSKEFSLLGLIDVTPAILSFRAHEADDVQHL
ncbi:hypothetical protein ACVIIW_000051 [Bradyrhizobium sp. USDA 4449]